MGEVPHARAGGQRPPRTRPSRWTRSSTGPTRSPPAPAARSPTRSARESARPTWMPPPPSGSARASTATARTSPSRRTRRSRGHRHPGRLGPPGRRLRRARLHLGRPRRHRVRRRHPPRRRLGRVGRGQAGGGARRDAGAVDSRRNPSPGSVTLPRVGPRRQEGRVTGRAPGPAPGQVQDLALRSGARDGGLAEADAGVVEGDAAVDQDRKPPELRRATVRSGSRRFWNTPRSDRATASRPVASRTAWQPATVASARPLWKRAAISGPGTPESGPRPPRGRGRARRPAAARRRRWRPRPGQVGGRLVRVGEAVPAPPPGPRS